LYEGLQDNLFSAPGTWSLKKCRSERCGVVWLDPMPAADDLFQAYRDYYTHGNDSARSPLFKFAKSLYRLAVDSFLLIAGVPIERKRAELMFLGDRSPGTILDIGCGQGTFLAVMAKRGWSVMGVDFDIEAVAAARRLHGIDVRVGTVNTVVDSGNKFDVVTASHVIEHVPDPLEFLMQCRELLRPGGCVVLRTPNVDSLGHRRYGRSWRGLESPRHLHLFTVGALEACGKRAGFADTLCFTSSVGAEGILLASHFLEKRGEFRPSKLSNRDAVESKLLGPLFALRGKMAWLLDRSSGEEICAVLTNGKSATAE
jgi:SAM-dependent methyltransferase